MKTLTRTKKRPVVQEARAQCLWCKKPFRVYSHSRTRCFCSRQCQAMWNAWRKRQDAEGVA